VGEHAVTSRTIEDNKQLARAFVAAINQRDMAALERLFHPDFIWFTAVVGEDDPNELRPMQSKELRGRNLPHWKPRLDRQEALTVFQSLFQGRAGEAHRAASGAQPAEAPSQEGDMGDFHITILDTFAEGDRVAMEAESNQINPDNGRIYNNFYAYIFKIDNGMIKIFKEYQDTLHIYDYLAD
jgi:ketosteroid isomerase-like protein